MLCVWCALQLLMYLHDAEKTAVSSNKMGAGGLPKNQREPAAKVRMVAFHVYPSHGLSGGVFLCA
jgi:hypothetical protein